MNWTEPWNIMRVTAVNHTANAERNAQQVIRILECRPVINAFAATITINMGKRVMMNATPTSKAETGGMLFSGWTDPAFRRTKAMDTTARSTLLPSELATLPRPHPGTHVKQTCVPDKPPQCFAQV